MTQPSCYSLILIEAKMLGGNLRKAQPISPRPGHIRDLRVYINELRSKL